MEGKEKLEKERGAMILTLSKVERKYWSLVIAARPVRKGRCTRICTYTDTHMHMAMRVHTFCLLSRMVIDLHYLRFHIYDGQP